MSDRYKFLKSWTDTGSGKTFAPGAVCRMSEGDAAPLVDNGTLQQVAEFTICRKDIFAPGSCQPVTEEQAAAYNGGFAKGGIVSKGDIFDINNPTKQEAIVPASMLKKNVHK